MAEYTFDIPAFRISYPAFADTTLFPDSKLQMYWDTAVCILANYMCVVDDDGCRYRLLTLMTAHLAELGVITEGGDTPGQVQSASIGGVSVTMVTSPESDQFSWWLNTTPYGAQLLMMLQVGSAGGFYIGGGFERDAFRKAGGFF